MVVNVLADRDTVLGALDALETAFTTLASASLDGFAPAELLEILARREVLARRQPVVDHRVLQGLVARATPGELGGTSLRKVVAERLRISTGEAARRIGEAADLGPRVALTGEVLAPLLPALAAAQARGQVGGEHVRIVRKFFRTLPARVDAVTREQAEVQLASLATDFRPEPFQKAADYLAGMLQPDGEFADADRQRRRTLYLGPQGPDGLSRISGMLTAECRAVFEPILAKLAAPGMANPREDTPCLTGSPTAEQIQDDHRSFGQRTHDALLAAGQIVLGTKNLGELNGLPVTVIATTTVAELETAAGVAVTAAGSRLTITELIRLAGLGSMPYLAVFNGHGHTLHFGRGRRTASRAQRLALLARDRGCTTPGCTASGYTSQVHHMGAGWAGNADTNIDDLTLACGPDNRMATDFGWDTRLNESGRVEWIPPPHLDHGQPRVNPLHHPEHLLARPAEYWTEDPDPHPAPGAPIVDPPPWADDAPWPDPPPPDDDGEPWYGDHPDPDPILAWPDPDPCPDSQDALTYDDVFGNTAHDRAEYDTHHDFLARLNPDLLAALDPGDYHCNDDRDDDEPTPPPWQ